MHILEWILAALAGGLLTAGALRLRAENHLRAHMERIGSFEGSTYAQVLRQAGQPPGQVRRLPNGDLLRTWYERNYMLALRFNDRDICMGVEEERDQGGA